MNPEADPEPDDQQQRRSGEWPARAGRSLLALAGWVAAIAAVAAGMGWLYLLDSGHLLDVGPRVAGALPLEELARRAAQPLGRVALAWIPAGAAAAIALIWLARVRAIRTVVAVAILSLVILFPTTAASEAIERNERLSAHIGPALARAGIWWAVAFSVIGTLLVAAAAAWRRSGRETAPSVHRGGGTAAV